MSNESRRGDESVSERVARAFEQDNPPPGSSPDPDMDLEFAQPRRPWVLPALFLAVTFWMIWTWRAELEYGFSSPEPIVLGDALERDLKKADLPHNRLVTVKGMTPMLSVSARTITGDRKYVVLLNTNILVERAPETRGGGETREFTGRLMKAEGRKFTAVIDEYAKSNFEIDPAAAWVLSEGEFPRSGWQAPVGACVLLLLMAWNLFRLVHSLRSGRG